MRDLRELTLQLHFVPLLCVRLPEPCCSRQHRARIYVWSHDPARQCHSRPSVCTKIRLDLVAVHSDNSVSLSHRHVTRILNTCYIVVLANLLIPPRSTKPHCLHCLQCLATAVGFCTRVDGLSLQHDLRDSMQVVRHSYGQRDRRQKLTDMRHDHLDCASGAYIFPASRE